MKRALDVFVRDWPLKLAAVGLATILYGGLVLSENTRTWPGQVPITVVDPPPGGVLLTQPGSVESIRYRAPLEVAGRLTTDSFRATIDLSGLTPQAGAPEVEVPVRLIATDPRVSIVGHEPLSVGVRLDSVVGRSVPVTVERGVAPEGLALGPAQVDPARVLLRGASSRLAEVQAVVARVTVDASGLNVDQDVELEVLDEAGDLVPGIEVVPGEVRVRIDVARELAYAILPVVVDLVGSPARGLRIDAVTSTPTTVTVSGEAPIVERLGAVVTDPVVVDGLAEDLEAVVDLRLPPEVSLVGDQRVTVNVALAPARATRLLAAGLAPTGLRRDRQVTFSAPAVQVTVSGEVAALDALEAGDPAPLVGVVDLAGLGNGRHELPVAVTVPEGISVVSVAPATVVARIAPAAATPEPSVAPSPGDAPSPVPGGTGGEAPAAGSGASVPPSAGPRPGSTGSAAGPGDTTAPSIDPGGS